MEQLNDASPIVFYKAQNTKHDILDEEDFMLILCTPIQKYMLEKF